VKSNKRPEEPLIRRTDFANETITRQFEAEKQLSRSTITIGSVSIDSLKKTESATKSLEEQPVIASKKGHVEELNQIDVKVKPRRSHQERPTPNNSAQSGSRKSYLATKNEGRKSQHNSSIHRDTTPIRLPVKANIKGRLSKLSDYSQTTRSRTKEPNSKVKNSGKTRTVITTEDGVDHHCQCTYM